MSQRTCQLQNVYDFVFSQRAYPNQDLHAISLFSGGGIGDIGYEKAGFSIFGQCEIDLNRALLCKSNFLNSYVEHGSVSDSWDILNWKFKHTGKRNLDLLVITPPCQGMSSSNPGRGKMSDHSTRDERNSLLLDSIPAIKAFMPRIIAVENVVQLGKESHSLIVEGINEPIVTRILDTYQHSLPDYKMFVKNVQMADYGIPQNRKRIVIVAVHRSEQCLDLLKKNKIVPFPAKKLDGDSDDPNKKWITIREWFERIGYQDIDAVSKDLAVDANDPLHFVPVYSGDRYIQISDIPPMSGKNAYENPFCRNCDFAEVPVNLSHCPMCNSPMHNRPYVIDKDGFRLIKGFDSSYRRMWPDRPASTITTSSSHVGSDNKIHPWENRVLSIRECADLQSLPRYYNWEWAFWSKRLYLSRQVVGEAMPSYFTYLQGVLFNQMLSGTVKSSDYESSE